jgi:hypothetical protein
VMHQSRYVRQVGSISSKTILSLVGLNFAFIVFLP